MGKYQSAINMTVDTLNYVDSVLPKYVDTGKKILSNELIAITNGVMRGKEKNECVAYTTCDELTTDEMIDLLEGNYDLYDRLEKCSSVWYELVNSLVIEKSPLTAMENILDEIEKTAYPGLGQYINSMMKDSLMTLADNYEHQVTKNAVSWS